MGLETLYMIVLCMDVPSSFHMNLIKKRGLLSRGGEETVLNRDSKGTRRQLTIKKVVWKLV